MNTNNREALTADVQRLSAELKQAQKDVALLQRLKSSEAEAKRIAAELAAAQDALVTANAAAVQAKRAAAYSAFKDIAVTESGKEPSVLHRTHTITVTRLQYDMYSKANLPTTQTYGGWSQLPQDAFGYLIDVHPEKIPASIMALCPDDPWDAFDRYFVSKRRGYLTGMAAA